MQFSKVSKLSSIFHKKAQLMTDVSSTNTISSDETSAFLEHAKMTAETANQIYEWANEQIGEPGTNPEQGKLNLFNFARDFRDTSTNFETKARDFIESTDSNKTISSIESNFNAMMQNYNNLTGPEQLNDQWVSDNQQFDLAQDVKQLSGSMKFMEEYIQKQKNVEANTENVPSLP